MSMLQPSEALPLAPTGREASSPDGARSFSILRRTGAWRDALRRRMLACADIAAVLTACVAVGNVSIGWTVALLPCWLILAKLHGLYDQDHRVLRHLTVDELPSLLAWATTGTALYVAVAAGIGSQRVEAGPAVTRWLLLLMLVVVLRGVARAAWRRIVPPEHAILVGSGPLETATLRKLELFEDIHVQVVDVLDDRAPAAGADLERIVSGNPDLDRVIVASTHVSEDLIAQQVALCRRHRLKLSVVPPARGMFGTAVQLHHIAELPLIEYSTWDVPRSTLLLKRGVDVVVASVALVVLGPLMLAIAIGVKLTSRGPAFFVQERAGVDGKPFRMVKFRTMVVDAERRLAEVVSLEDLADPVFKVRNDPRVTRLGAFLRRSSLDELPQLTNVLRGQMSLVGPRPEQLNLVERYAPEHRFRLHVKPGITGPMQVFGRGELRFDERLAVEREYVENLSLKRDVRLLLLTMATVVRGRGAF